MISETQFKSHYIILHTRKQQFEKSRSEKKSRPAHENSRVHVLFLQTQLILYTRTSVENIIKNSDRVSARESAFPAHNARVEPLHVMCVSIHEKLVYIAYRDKPSLAIQRAPRTFRSREKKGKVRFLSFASLGDV